MKIVNHSVKLINVNLDPVYAISPIDAVEAVAKTCYQSELAKTEEKKIAFIKRLIKNGHTAMIEFADVTFRIITDRGVTHELVRHRIANFAQESTRYCNYGNKDIEFIKPISIPVEYNDNRSTPFEIWEFVMKEAEYQYKRMLDIGCSPQIARSVLPNSLKTEINVKFNMRSFRNFIMLRTAKTAHPDMQHVANLCVKELWNTDYRVFFEDLVE